MGKQSPLAALHQTNGAHWTNQDDWTLPEHFGRPVDEYETVRGGAGIFDLTHRSMLQFTGPDRVSFLQGMLSNDLKQIKMFEGQRATLLTQQGKVVADVRVLCAMNSIYLDFWEALKEKILTHLNRYLVADEVEINDPNEQWKILSLQGPKAQSLLEKLFNTSTLPALDNAHLMVQSDGAPVCVVRADRTGYDGFDMIAETEHLAPLAGRLIALGAGWVGAGAQEILRIEAGIPRYGVDFDEDTLLLEVGLDDAISFTKGCYLGQEIVERIRSRGHVNKKLCGLLLDGPTTASPGDPISRDGKAAGKITCSVTSLALKRAIALGYVSREFSSDGTRLTIEHAQAEIAATVTRMPFVSPTGAT